MFTPRFSVGPDALVEHISTRLPSWIYTVEWEGMEEHGRNEQRRDKKIKGRKGRKTVI